jgi:hypothetical protein
MHRLTHSLFDAAHWRERAEQALEVAEEAATIADSMYDREAQRIMRAIAEDYAARAAHARSMERMAEQHRERDRSC